MNNHNKILLFLGIFSVLYSLFFINIYQYPILGDGHHYYAYGLNLYKGNGYSYQEFFPFRQSNLREPAYPIFIYLVFKIFGISMGIIQIAQAVLNGIIVAATYKLAQLIFNDKKKALTAAFLTAVSPTIAGYAALVASETLATVCLLAILLSFLALLKEKKNNKAIAFAVLTGFFCGCLALTKMAYFLFFPLMCFALFMLPMDKPIKYKSGLCIVIVSIAILSPWFSFNNRLYGNPFFLTNRGGMALTTKAQRLNWTPKEALVSFIYPVSEGLVQKYFPQEYKKVTYNPVDNSNFKAAFDIYDALIAQGYSEMAADKQMRADALKEIKGHLLKYIILSISDFHFMLYFEGLPLSQFTGFFKRENRMWINAFFKIYSLLILFFAIKGTFRILRHKENRSLKIAFLLPIFYTFFIYSAIFGAPRFTFAVIPLIYILAADSIYEMFKVRISL